jgi:hypothetical protein
MYRKLGVVAWLGLAACNTSQEGAQGNILFTPDECGRLDGCDFADSIGVGGTIQVHIQGIDGFSTAGVTLASDDPMVLDVQAIGDVGGRPTWEATGTGAGVGRIVAYDAADTQVDFLEVGVQELAGLILDPFVGDAVGPTADGTYDEIWSVNADQPTSFQVTPVIGADVPTMGVYQYVAVIDNVMEASLEEGADLGAGYLYFSAPAGDYEVSFATAFDGSIALDALIQAVGSD